VLALPVTTRLGLAHGAGYDHALLCLAGLLAMAAILSPPARSQDNYEIQVYGSELVEPGHTMVELHSNFTIDGTKTMMDGLYPTNHAEHETVEITHGFNNWFETGFYIFTSIHEGQGWQWVGNHIRPRVRVPEKWNWPVGVSLSNEIGYQRRQFSLDTWTREIRPIVDQRIGRWYWSINPVLDRAWHGPDVNQGLVFSPNFKFSISCDQSRDSSDLVPNPAVRPRPSAHGCPENQRCFATPVPVRCPAAGVPNRRN
jgi:hypothetical protein